MDKGSVIHCHFPIIGQLHSIDIAQALVTNISTKGGDAQLADEVAESQSTPHVNSTFRIMWREAEPKEHRRRSLQNFVRVHHNHFLILWTERRVHPFGGRVQKCHWRRKRDATSSDLGSFLLRGKQAYAGLQITPFSDFVFSSSQPFRMLGQGEDTGRLHIGNKLCWDAKPT